MISFFRSFLNSKIGAAVALGVLAIIAIAFASGDIAGQFGSSGVNGGNAVATVGDKSVDAAELVQSANQALERVKQQQPTATMKLLVAQGGVEQVLGDLIDRTALFVFGRNHGMAISDRLIDSEIAQIQAFQGVDGKFDQKTYRQALEQQGLSEKSVRDDIANTLTARQVMLPASLGAIMPEYAARRYAALLDETRTGSVVALPSILFAPAGDPSDAQLGAYYKAHTDSFIRPERRVLRYAVFTEAALKNPPAPTEAEIAARYQANKVLYAPQDKRKITQLIVPTEPAARAILAAAQGGKSLEAVASEKGLSAASLAFLSREELAGQASADVATAVFAAPLGKIAEPRKSALGWHLIRVDQEQKKPGRALAEVRDELSKQVAEEKRRKAFADMTANIEEQFDGGANLAEVAKAIGVEIKTTKPLTADGRVYATDAETAPVELREALSSAFAMEQEEPQVAPIMGGIAFLIYDVTDIAPSAPAPLAEIKGDVTQAWKLDAGARAARAAAIRMQAEIRKGKSLEQAIAGTGRKLPPVEKVAMSRPMLAAALQSGKPVPPPVSLMFQMARGTAKVQAAAQDRGWFVVLLNDIVPGKVESPELVRNARRELGQQLGQAYGDALAGAIRGEVGVTRHAGVITSVRNQLGGVAPAN